MHISRVKLKKKYMGAQPQEPIPGGGGQRLKIQLPKIHMPAGDPYQSSSL